MKTDNVHARLLAALRGEKYFDPAEPLAPSQSELDEQKRRAERTKEITIPANAHMLLVEAINGTPKTTTGDDHRRLAKALGVRA
jgi:hypothetical protein